MAPALVSNRYAALVSESENAEESRDEGLEKKAPKERLKKRKLRAPAERGDGLCASTLSEECPKKKRRKARVEQRAPTIAEACATVACSEDQLASAARDCPHAAIDTEGVTKIPDLQSPGVKAVATVPLVLGATKLLPGGIRIEVIRAAPESSRIAVKGDVVKLLYEGRLPAKDNKSFDKGDIDFVLGDGSMVVGFDRGVAGMAVGERRLIHIPSKFGYGKKGKKPKVPPNSDLVFDVIMTSVGCDWNDMTFSSMSNARREASRRRGKKPRKT